MKFCSNCGVELIDKPNFCQSCGTKLFDSSVTNFNKDDNPTTQIKEEEINQEFNQNEINPSEGDQLKSINEKFKRNYTKIVVVISIVLILGMGLAIFIFTNENSINSNNKNISTADPNSNKILNGNDSTEQPTNVVENPQSGSQEDEITQRNISLRNNWTSYISASRSSFNYSDMGGISDLSIIVTNNTEYVVDNVTVKVTIKTVNNYVYKTEYLYFENIKSNSRVEQFVMPTERGRYVEYEIIHVYSDRLNFKWDEGDNTGNGSINDPWKFNY